jgi:hypothetical protein
LKELTVKNSLKTLSTIALAAILVTGATACGSNGEKASPSATSTAPAAEKTSAEAVKAIEGFVAATTSDEVAAALPDKVTADTFTPALGFVALEESDTEKVKKAISDFALAKVNDPKVKYTVTVDAAAITIDGDNATVPADKVTVNADGKKAATSDELAKNTTTLKYVDGAWKLTFPKDEPKPTETATPAATTTETATPAPTESK